MRRFGVHVALAVLSGLAIVTVWDLPAAGQPGDALWHHRNLGKAFYENPTTGALAVEEFKKALDLVPNSVRERATRTARSTCSSAICSAVGRRG